MATIRNKTDWSKEQIEQEIYRELITEFSERLMREVGVLEEAQMVDRADANVNPIGFIYFHILRAWERDVNHLIQGQAQADDAWHRIGLVAETGFDPSHTGYHGWGNGTGYSDAEVDALPKGKAYLLKYHQALFDETMAYLDSIIDEFETFGREIHHADSPFNPFTPRWRLQHLITHSGRHIGDIQTLKGMMGYRDGTYPG